MTTSGLTAADALGARRAALQRGAWAEASARFQEALDAEESPAAYEGLGIAARYLSSLESAVSAHERGYRLARSRGDDDQAARLAAQLALDAYGLGRVAEANGWLERALMLTDPARPSEARAVALALRAHMALLVRNDPGETRELSAQAVEIAKRVPADFISSYYVARKR